MGAGASAEGGPTSKAKGHELVNAVLSQQWAEAADIVEKVGRKIDLTVRDPEMAGTALIWAAALKHDETVQLLLELGADPNLQTNDGRSCMHTAAIGNQVQMLVQMKKHGCDTELITQDGLTALMAACQYGCADAVAALIDLGAEKEAAANDCRSPLHCACEEGSLRVVELLLESGCEPDFTNSGGGTPLHVAAMNGHLKIMQSLLTKGATITKKTKAGMTPLHVASLFGHTQLASELITAGALVNERRNDGQTPLHLAIKKSRVKTVLMLVEKGADWSNVDKIDNPPLAYAPPFLLTRLDQDHHCKEAKQWMEKGGDKVKKESTALPGALPTAYTTLEEALQRTPKMEHRSPMMKYRKIGEGDAPAASCETPPVGTSRRLNARQKSKGSLASNSKAKNQGKCIDRKAEGSGGSPSGGISGSLSNRKLGTNAAGMPISSASSSASGSGASGSAASASAVANAGKARKFSPIAMGRRLRVQFNSPANITRRMPKRGAKQTPIVQ